MNDVPAADRTRIITTPDGRDLALCVWGDPQGAPIFWLHGTPGSRMFRDPSDCYQRYRLAVCSYDRPGYGLSTRRRGHTQAQNVDDVVAIADALGWERFAVAGASGGTAPALAAARFQPERVTRCAVIVGVAPPTAEEIQDAMSEDDRGEWERDVRGDEEELARAFDDFLKWFDAKMPGVDIDDEDSLRMLEELVFEARRQGPGGYIDDLIAGAHDWGFAVEDIRVPTRIMAAQDDSPFMHENSRWLADHIPGAELLWRAGGHVNPKDDAESRLFGWLGYGVDPTPA
jgi:pimeloyl-ACP methyl ester carboxylesterase